MLRIHPAATLVVVLLSTACTPPGSSSSSSSSSSGSATNEPAVMTAYRQVFTTLCGYWERCKTVIGPAYSSTEACAHEVNAQALMDAWSYYDQSVVFNVDQTKLQACLTALDAAQCADRVPQELFDCQAALAPKTPKTVGQGCSTEFTEGAPRCADSETLYCAGNNTGCGTCAQRKANNEPCNVNEECLSNYCNTVLGANRCAPIPSAKGLNEGCIDTAECKGALVCAGPFLQKKCSERAGPGETCSVSRNGEVPECMLDLTCVAGGSGGVCASRLEDGASCSRNTPGQAGCRGFCRFSAHDDLNGVCATLSDLPRAGEPCAVRSLGGNPVPFCSGSAELFTDETFSVTGNNRTSVSCECAPRKDTGSCFEDEACRSYNCNGDTATAAGQCVPLLGNGAQCSTDGECTSGYCNRTGRTCADPVVCQ